MSWWKCLVISAGFVLCGGCTQVNPQYYSSRRDLLGQPAAKSSAATAPPTNSPPASTPR